MCVRERSGLSPGPCGYQALRFAKCDRCPTQSEVTRLETSHSCPPSLPAPLPLYSVSVFQRSKSSRVGRSAGGPEGRGLNRMMQEVEMRRAGSGGGAPLSSSESPHGHTVRLACGRHDTWAVVAAALLQPGGLVASIAGPQSQDILADSWKCCRAPR